MGNLEARTPCVIWYYATFKKGVIFIAINDLVKYNIRIEFLFNNSLLIITESFIFLKFRNLFQNWMYCNNRAKAASPKIEEKTNFCGHCYSSKHGRKF